MTDEKIIELFFDRSESALTELEEKYGKICLQTSKNILGNVSDAEECVNDSYLGVWKAIPPVKPEPLLTYLLKIVKNISLNRYHKNTAQKRNSTYDVAVSELENVLVAKDDIESKMESEELSRIIDGFLETLRKENRVIFMRRYWFFDTYEQIAKRMGITEKNVSVKLTRIRKQMREYLQEKGVYL